MKIYWPMKTSNEEIRRESRGNAKFWQTEGDMAQNCQEAKNSSTVQFVEGGSGGCSGHFTFKAVNNAMLIYDEWFDFFKL